MNEKEKTYKLEISIKGDKEKMSTYRHYSRDMGNYFTCFNNIYVSKQIRTKGSFNSLHL